MVEVVYRSNKLRQCYQDSRRASREWGNDVGKRYIERVNFLLSMRQFSEIFAHRAWRAHPLKGEREGQYAINLTGQWRLIVTRGRTDTEVRVEEVSNHYD